MDANGTHAWIATNLRRLIPAVITVILCEGLGGGFGRGSDPFGADT